MIIFVCHPLRSSGTIEGNIEKCKAIAREISLRGDTPYVPHFSALYLSCEVKEEDDAGIRDALVMLLICDKVEVHGLIGGAMHQEIKLAQALGKPIDFSGATIKYWMEAGIPLRLDKPIDFSEATIGIPVRDGGGEKWGVEFQDVSGVHGTYPVSSQIEAIRKKAKLMKTFRHIPPENFKIEKVEEVK